MNNQKSVELTVLVELFSTFFDKITLSHPEKDVLMKELSNFKNVLYSNQENLEKGYDYLVQLRQQFQKQQQQLSQPSQPQQQQTIQAQPMSTQQLQPAITQFQQTPSIIPSQQQNELDVMNFDLTQLNEQKINKFYKVSEYPGFYNNMFTINNLDRYTSIRDFVSEVNTVYRCVGYRYFEQLLKEHNESKLQDIIQQVQNKRIELRNYFFEDEVSKENLKRKFCGFLKYILKNFNDNIQDILYKMINADNIFDAALVSFVKEICVKYIQESDPLYIKFLMQNQKLENQTELINMVRSTQDPPDIIFKIISGTFECNLCLQTMDMEGGGTNFTEQNYKYNAVGSKVDSVFLIHLLKMQNPFTIYCILYPNNPYNNDQVNSSAPNAGILKENQKIQNTNKTFNNNFMQQQQQQPQQIQQQIQPQQIGSQYQIGDINNLTEQLQQQQSINDYDYHEKSSTPKMQTRNIKQPSSITGNTNFSTQMQGTISNNNQNSGAYLGGQNIQNNNSKQQQQQQIQRIDNDNKPQQIKQDQPIEDLKVKANYLIKMLKTFSQNTEELVDKLTNFKDSDDENDMEEDDQKEQDNIEKMIKEQINGSKSRTINFYSSIAKDPILQDKEKKKNDKWMNDYPQGWQLPQNTIGYSKVGQIDDTFKTNALNNQNFVKRCIKCSKEMPYKLNDTNYLCINCRVEPSEDKNNLLKQQLYEYQ